MGQSKGPLVMDQYLPSYTNGLWEPMTHRGILSQARHIGEGLGTALNDMTDFEDSPWKSVS